MGEFHKVRCDKCGIEDNMVKALFGGMELPKAWLKAKDESKLLCYPCSVKYRDHKFKFFEKG
jgi:hypothetical protein